MFSLFSKGSWNLDPQDKVSLGHIIKNTWKLAVIITVPAVLTFIPVYWKGVTGKEPCALYVMMLMAIFWCTEVLPLPVTSFIPVILYPIFGIASTGDITSAYLSDSIMFLFSGCLMALSFEYTNLHSRIALKVIMMVGARISQLMLGIMITTMFMSMWMNNTSTTAMMVPIVHAIMDELKKKLLEANEIKRNSVTDGVNYDYAKQKRKIDKRIRDMKTMFLLATAYSSNIGGTGVLTGSGTNVVVLDIVRKESESESLSDECKYILDIRFLDWMIFNFPPMVLNTLMCWAYLQFHFMGVPNFLKFWSKSKENDQEREASKRFETSVKKSMKKQYDELGPIKFNEICVLTLFSIVVILWVFKDPQFIPGWDSFFERTASGKSIVKESTATLLICFLMCVIPSKPEYYKNFAQGAMEQGIRDPLLSFSFIQKNFPWGVFMVLGGGTAMAVGSRESGLNKFIEEFLKSNETLQAMPGPAVLMAVLLFVATLTSIASNTATAAIVTPVLIGVSYVKNLHPMYMVYPASSASSYAFALPVSTPPNAIVYGSSDLKISDMLKPGTVITLLSLVVLFITTHTTSWWIFNFGGYKGECSAKFINSTVFS